VLNPRASLILCCLLATVGRASADPQTLRFATIIPDGSAYAREAKAFGRDVENDTGGRVRVKWLFAGVTGDEMQTLERIRRGQVDGAATSLACSQLAPSLRVFRMPGLFESRHEARQVMARLRTTVAEELSKNGFTLLGIEPFGADVFLSREPIRSFDDLAHQRLWVWDRDDVWRAVAALFGLRVTPLPLDQVSRALDEHRLDGVIALPTAALAYQWSTQLRYFTPLPSSYLQACLIVSNRAFDPLTLADQRAMQTAGAKAAARFEQVCADQDGELLSGMFEKQGLKKVPTTAALATAFRERARAAADRIDERLVPRALRERVAAWLTEIRAASKAASR
jgi:TRAP-type C4-dicarboxylate transport system substrate-binding protein